MLRPTATSPPASYTASDPSDRAALLQAGVMRPGAAWLGLTGAGARSSRVALTTAGATTVAATSWFVALDTAGASVGRTFADLGRAVAGTAAGAIGAAAHSAGTAAGAVGAAATGC